MAHYVWTGTGIRQLALHLTLTGHPRDHTRDMKPRPKLAGIWMVSKAREDGLNGKVTGKMCLASMSNWGESFLSRRRTCKDKKAMTSAFGQLTANNHLTKMICAYRLCANTHSVLTWADTFTWTVPLNCSYFGQLQFCTSLPYNAIWEYLNSLQNEDFAQYLVTTFSVSGITALSQLYLPNFPYFAVL